MAKIVSAFIRSSAFAVGTFFCFNLGGAYALESTPAEKLCAAVDSLSVQDAQSALTQGADANSACDAPHGRLWRSALNKALSKTRSPGDSAESIALLLIQTGAKGNFINYYYNQRNVMYHSNFDDAAATSLAATLAFLAKGVDPNTVNASIQKRKHTPADWGWRNVPLWYQSTGPAPKRLLETSLAIRSAGGSVYGDGFSFHGVLQRVLESNFESSVVVEFIQSWDFVHDPMKVSDYLNVALMNHRSIEVLSAFVAAGASLNPATALSTYYRLGLSEYSEQFRTDPATLKYLYNLGVSVNGSGGLALAVAMTNVDLPLLRFLLENGANPDLNGVGPKGNDLLEQYSWIFAAGRGSESELHEMVKLLVQYGVHLEREIPYDNGWDKPSLQSPLQVAIAAISLPLVKILVEFGARLDHAVDGKLPYCFAKDLGERAADITAYLKSIGAPTGNCGP